MNLVLNCNKQSQADLRQAFCRDFDSYRRRVAATKVKIVRVDASARRVSSLHFATRCDLVAHAFRRN
eukprot:8464-Eustigmatos_ZCMA.PRE.1